MCVHMGVCSAQLDVPNLHVMKLMQSMKSRGHVKELFSWQYYYWFLTDSGIEYLRAYLHLPADVVPMSLRKRERPAGTLPTRPAGPRGDRPPREGGREGYRREGGAGFGGEKKVGAEAGFAPTFRGGYPGGRGRGAAAPPS
jgi:small subunit ribosomal protein S10e